jgi:hypothetical protein
MSARTKVALAIAMTFSAVTPSMAAFWDCITVPEIDGSAGISAVAAVIAVGMVAYQRVRQ